MTEYKVNIQRNLMAQMRDGIFLSSDVYTPDEKGNFPVLLMRTPYSKEAAHTEVYAHPLWYANHGYIVVIQDVRGRWSSGGEWYPFTYEVDDGYDSIEWAANLPKSNGKVGMYGFSYDGATQLLAAKALPPHLSCIVPAMTSVDFYDGWVYRGGVLNLAFIMSWSLGLAVETARRRGLKQQMADLIAAFHQLPILFDQLPIKNHDLFIKNNIAPWFFDWLNHPIRDDYWNSLDINTLFQHIQVPSLHIGGWYDIFLRGTLNNYIGVLKNSRSSFARANQHLIITPWIHTPWSSIVSGWNFEEEATNNIDSIQLRWFDYWLKDIKNGVEADSPVKIFIMGKNTWRSEQEWPIKRVVYREYYFHSSGLANSISGNGLLSEIEPENEPQDHFIYDPLDSVPSMGGRSCCRFSGTPMGPADQWKVEIRNDVLIYSSEVLATDIEVTGDIKVVLYASSNVINTDWVVKLVDVYPDNKAINITDGIIRTGYREAEISPVLLEKGHIYEFTIDLWSTSNVFKTGHRIRCEVSSSNFPCFDRNLNTGGELGEEWMINRIIASQTVFHDSLRPSRIILPIIQTS